MSSAASLILDTSSTFTSQRSQTTNPPNKNYLNRCVEELSLSDSNAVKIDRNATACKIRAYAVFALYVCAAVVAVTVVWHVAPAYVLMSTVPILGFFPPILKKYKQMSATADAHTENAEKIRAIAREYQAIQSKDNPSTFTTLSSLASRISIDDIERFKPILAHYNYWNRLHTVYEEEVQKQIAQAKAADNTEKSIHHYIVANNLKHLALVAKVSCAVNVAVMNNPAFQGVAQDICTTKNFKLCVDYPEMTLSSPLTNNAWAQRALFREFDDKRVDEFLVFKNKNIASISLDDAQAFSIQQIAQRILAAM